MTSHHHTHTNEAHRQPGPAAITRQFNGEDPISVADHLADAAPTTATAVADKHHPTRTGPNPRGRSSQ
jgi:hypothetical protein